MKVASRWKRRWWRYFSIRRCDVCRVAVRLRFKKLWLFDPEEPPLFGTYYCPRCGAEGAVRETGIATSAARSMGYPSGVAWLKDFAVKMQSAGG